MPPQSSRLTCLLEKSAFRRPRASWWEVSVARPAAPRLTCNRARLPNGLHRALSSVGPHGGFPPPPLHLPDSTSWSSTCPLAGPVLRSQRGAGPLNEWRAGRPPPLRTRRRSECPPGAGRAKPAEKTGQEPQISIRSYVSKPPHRSMLEREGLRTKLPELQRWLPSIKSDILAIQEVQFSPLSRYSDFPVFSPRSSSGEQEDALPLGGREGR